MRTFILFLIAAPGSEAVTCRYEASGLYAEELSQCYILAQNYILFPMIENVSSKYAT